jgi:UTP:GlnB (protein PII) uridylyltransferase
MAMGLRLFDVDRPTFGQYAEFAMGKGRPAGELNAELRSTLQAQLLPRLVLAHGAPSTSLTMSLDERTPPTAEEVALLAQLAAEQDLVAALRLVASLVDQGMSQASVLLLLVAPAARLLNQQWSEEERAFAEVMDALKIIQHVADTLRPPPPPAIDP